jgi:hypothetical protein
VGCVRYWCRRLRAGGTDHTHFHRPSTGPLGRFLPRVCYVLLRLRLQHPHWGPASIHYHLSKRPSLKGARLPSGASIGRYLHQWVRFRRPPHQGLPRERPSQLSTVHQRWQIDFKLGIGLRDGTRVNLHTVRDPVGEACLGAQVFPAGRTNQRRSNVTWEQVRAVLRTCFTRWGTLPAEVQTDGEPVLIGQASDPFPSFFTLWLKGLGIAHRVIRPGRPTDNAEVERCHRTVNDYGIVGNEKTSWQRLQILLDQAVYELNFELSSQAAGCHGQPPVVAHPELLQRPRPFQPEEELVHFDLQGVDAYLATFTWKRKVDRNGHITLAGRHVRYLVGRLYAGQEVWVRFDPRDRHYVFYRDETPDQEIGRQRTRGLEVNDLTGLEVWPSGPGPQQLPLPLTFNQGVSCG